MFLADSHTHSSCSPDGTVPMSEMTKGAITAGVKRLCITDHCDFMSFDGTERTPYYDWKPVLEQYREAKSLLHGELDLQLGLEFGVSFLDPEAARKVLSFPELDFVIGAVHNLDEEAGGKDFYLLDYDTEEHCYWALDHYFDSMEHLADSGFYDVLAHIIYPLRYMKGNYERPISMTRYTDQIRRILTKAVELGRGIEINTWKGKTIEEWVPILKLYKECKGEILTVGSDAHAPKPVGRGITEAYSMMQDLGFRYVAYYHQRKPEFIKL